MLPSLAEEPTLYSCCNFMNSDKVATRLGVNRLRSSMNPGTCRMDAKVKEVMGRNGGTLKAIASGSGCRT
jgi:hypothetical protein